MTFEELEQFASRIDQVIWGEFVAGEFEGDLPARTASPSDVGRHALADAFAFAARTGSWEDPPRSSSVRPACSRRRRPSLRRPGPLWTETGRCHTPNVVPWSDANLLVAVEALAASPEVQRAHARTLPSWPLLDEMALELDCELGRIQGRSFDGAAAHYVEALMALDRKLAAISGEANEALWLPDALDGPVWAEIRELARTAVRLAVPTGL